MKIAPILDPSKRKPGPKPAKVDLRIIFAIGTVLWVIVAIIYAVIRFGFHTHGTYLPFVVSASGVIIGIGLLIWEHWYRPEYMKLADEEE